MSRPPLAACLLREHAALGLPPRAHDDELMIFTKKSPTALHPVAHRAPVDSAAMPSQHTGLLRRVDGPFTPVRVLVDSGSQQRPLISLPLARAMGACPRLESQATQAGGGALPIYDVGRMDMMLNGTPVPTAFGAAAIHPYDVILGESWLSEHRVVLDYADHRLWTKSATGAFAPLHLDGRSASGWLASSSEMQALDRRVADTPTLQSMPATPELSFDEAPSSGARLRRMERRHEGPLGALSRLSPESLAAVVDFAKELPEDADFELGEIPGLQVPARASFDYIEAEVRTFLAHLPSVTVDSVLARLRSFETDVFENLTMPRPPPERAFDVTIPEKPGAVPPARRPYPVAPHHVPELERQIRVLLDAGIIRPSMSQYSAPVLFAPKKDGKLRLCVDYRMLNSQTMRDRFPTPTAADLIARTRGARMFSKIDLHSGFHQLRISPQDVHKTAFATPFGLYEWVSAPFGLTGVPGAFQRFMQFVLHKQIEEGICLVYCDDIAVFTKSDDPLEHLRALESVLGALREHQLLAKGAKCELFRREFEFLGFLVSGEGVRVLPAKVEAVRQIPVPETVSHLRSFLGMTNFFRSHLPSYSDVAAPLTSLLRGVKRGSQRLPWTLECDQAFNYLKEMLTTAPVLRHFDPTLRTAIHVDASTQAVGAVLLQWEEGEAEPRPVAFLSRKFQGAQYHYDARNAESLAISIALSTWRTLLYGIHFELFSDHASLTSLLRQKNPSLRILRLCEFLADFDFDEVRYVRGVDNAVPDFLSRPWDAARRPLHALSHPRPCGSSSLLSLAAGSAQDQVWVLPTHGSMVAACQLSGRFSLLRGTVAHGHTAAQTARRLVQQHFPTVRTEPRLHLRGRLAGISLWALDFSPVPLPSPALPQVAWYPMSILASRPEWCRSHFDALPAFGCLASGPNQVTVAPSLALLGSAQAGTTPVATADSEPLSSLLLDIKEEQGGDALLQHIRDGIDASDTGVWRDFFLSAQGLLCYQRAEDANPRVCVPGSTRDAVLQAAHGDETLEGHPGVARTAAKVAHHFYWPGLHNDVAHFVRSCRVCARAKGATQAPLAMDAFSSVPVQPFSHWAMDLIGPLPKTRAGHDHIVTWVCRTSKTIVARPLRLDHSSARDLADLTFDAICCQYGLPLKLAHDNDVRFKTLWRDVWSRLGTKISTTTAYNPQSDPAERANRQVLEALRASVASVTDFDQWDRALPHICFGLNTHISSATHTSPFELMYGFAPRTPLTLGLPATSPSSHHREADDFVIQVRNRHQAAADHVAAAQVRLARRLDARGRPADIRVGHQMYLNAKPEHSPAHQIPFKLADRWMGPYRVLEVKGAAVRLDLPPELGKVSPWINPRRLKFFHPRDAHFTDPYAPVDPVHAPDGAARWEVQRILGRRHIGRQAEYCVQWRGFGTDRLSWVPRDLLVADVPRLVAAYDADPSVFQARPSAPKRASAGNALRRPPVAAAGPLPRRSLRLQR